MARDSAAKAKISYEPSIVAAVLMVAAFFIVMCCVGLAGLVGPKLMWGAADQGFWRTGLDTWEDDGASILEAAGAVTAVVGLFVNFKLEGKRAKREQDRKALAKMRLILTALMASVDELRWRIRSATAIADEVQRGELDPALALEYENVDVVVPEAFQVDPSLIEFLPEGLDEKLVGVVTLLGSYNRAVQRMSLASKQRQLDIAMYHALAAPLRAVDQRMNDFRRQLLLAYRLHCRDSLNMNIGDEDIERS